MASRRKLAILLAAWAIPFAWVAVALSAGPTDGTAISSPTAWLVDDEPTGVLVRRTYGDTPLREGDVVLEIDGKDMTQGSGGDVEGSPGDRLPYRVLRPGTGLDRILTVQVELSRFPLASALVRDLATTMLVGGLLVAGSWVFWRRPRDPAALAVLTAGSAVTAGVTVHPWGASAVDLTGARGTWPLVGGGLAIALAAGAVLVFALTFPWTRVAALHRPLGLVIVVAVPIVVVALGYLVIATAEPGPARWHQLLALPVVVMVLAFAVLVAATVHGLRRAPRREDRIALRLLVLAAASAVVVRLLLEDLPEQVSGQPLVPGNLLALVLVPVLLVSLVAAVLRFRLHEIDATLRRSLVQLLVASVVGAVFLAAIGAVNLASEVSFESMVAGGVVALILLPAALVLRRTLSVIVLGNPDLPYQVVSDLRRLDLRTAPAEALQEVLRVLGRRLSLSYAAVEVYGATAEDRILTSIGEPRGVPTSVVLEAAGTRLGELLLEADETRDPLGPRDRRLLEDVGSQVGTLVQAVAINRELQRSRERLVTAREEERRRVRRDLHDGLGPSLATMAMKLEVAQDLIEAEPDEAAQLVGQLAEQTRGDIGEIRRLVDGLRPPALDQLGLVTALRQRADEHNQALRLAHRPTGPTWTVRATGDLDSLPAAVEVAAYRIVVEAVTNALRHSAAETVEVRLERRGDRLDLRIVDDGTGIVPGVSDGLGLGSMTERAEELGGTCRVESALDVGTAVIVDLPVDHPDDEEAS